MRSKILCGLSIVAVSMMLAIPVYAYSGTANGGNGGLGNGMGTGTGNGLTAKSYGMNMYDGTTRGATGTNAMSGHEVSVYGTGTGSQFRNINPNAPGTMNQAPMYRSQSYSDNGYRAMSTSSNDDMDWGWLGLIGLAGLFGMRSRNPERR